MQKYFLVVIVSLSSLSQSGIKESIFKTYQNYLFAVMGSERLKPQHEQFIQGIMTELKMDQSLEIRKMNRLSIVRFGRDNAFVVPFGNCMFVSEEFFDELSHEERRFLIGHELMHIQKKHVHKKMAYGLAAIGIYYGLVRSRLHNSIDDNLITTSFRDSETRRVIKSLTDHFFMRGLLGLALLAISRVHEREADRESALQLGNSAARGGVKMWKRFQQKEPQCDTFFHRILSTHPTHPERIKNLEELEKRTAATVTRAAAAA